MTQAARVPYRVSAGSRRRYVTARYVAGCLAVVDVSRLRPGACGRFEVLHAPSGLRVSGDGFGALRPARWFAVHAACACPELRLMRGPADADGLSLRDRSRLLDRLGSAREAALLTDGRGVQTGRSEKRGRL